MILVGFLMEAACHNLPGAPMLDLFIRLFEVPLAFGLVLVTIVGSAKSCDPILGTQSVAPMAEDMSMAPRDPENAANITLAEWEEMPMDADGPEEEYEDVEGFGMFDVAPSCAEYTHEEAVLCDSRTPIDCCVGC